MQGVWDREVNSKMKKYSHPKIRFYLQERELIKYMKEYDADGDGTLDFEEFETAMRFAQQKKKNQIYKDEVDVWE